MKIVGTKKTFDMLPQFFDIDVSDKKVVVGEGDTLLIGKHNLQFFMAPMVHWPEVMVTYDLTDKILFSADAFGKFGALDVEEEWANEARRYYINIVGKYPVLKENLGYYIDLYDKWSRYVPEKHGVLIAYNSIYGNTRNAVEYLAEQLKNEGMEDILVTDLARADISKAVSDAFYYDILVVACPTHDAGLFPRMERFLASLSHKNFQNRKVAIIENGSWAPSAAKCMRDMLEKMKDITIVEPVITIKSSMKEENKNMIKELAKKL